MSWAKLDDRYDDHPKVEAAWQSERGAVALHAMAITYSARHETDGRIDAAWLAKKLPAKRERERLLAVLVEVGLFESVGDGRYIVHDFLNYNPSKASLDDRRKRDAERKRAAGSARNPSGVQADSDRSENGGPHGFQTESGRIPNDPSRERARVQAGSGRDVLPLRTRDQRG